MSEQLKQTILTFLNTQTWDEAQSFVEQHPELLTDDADHLLQHFADIQSDSHLQIRDERALLRRCREIGINVAFAEKKSGPRIPSLFQEAIYQAQMAQQRYFDTGNHNDLDEAITILDSILCHPEFRDTPERFQLAVLNNTAKVYWHHYEIGGQITDLDKTLELLQQVVNHTPSDSFDRPDYVNNLGLAFSEKYKYSHERADLDNAIIFIQEAVDLTSSEPNYPTRPRHLNNLGRVLSERYDHTGNLADLEMAIEVLQEAVRLTADKSDYPGRLTMLNNLGIYLSSRYSRTGVLADLAQAIITIEQAIHLSPNEPGPLSNLGAWLSERFKRTGQITDLEEAIKVTYQAVTLTPEGAPTRASFINDLGNRLGELYEQTRSLADLNQAIEVTRLAVQLAPDQPHYLNNLGISLSERYHLTGSPLDLDEALEITQKAVDLTPENAPYRPAHLTNLGNRLQEQGDLAGAKEVYREACNKGLNLALEKVVGASRNWGNLALRCQEWQGATEAYHYGIEATNRLYRFQPKREWKEAWLAEGQEHYVRSAYAYARYGDMTQAIAALEQGRAFMLAESLERERADLSRLPGLGYADLYQAYQNVTNKLLTWERQPQVNVKHLQTVWLHLDDIIAQIQAIPGYDNFFRPPAFADVVAAIQMKGGV